MEPLRPRRRAALAARARLSRSTCWACSRRARRSSRCCSRCTCRSARSSSSCWRAGWGSASRRPAAARSSTRWAASSSRPSISTSTSRPRPGRRSWCCAWCGCSRAGRAARSPARRWPWPWRSRPPGSRSWRRRSRRASCSGSARGGRCAPPGVSPRRSALGAALAAPVLVLVAGQLEGSARGQGFPTDVVLAHSVHPFALVQTVVGSLFGNPANLANEWWGQNFFPRGFPVRAEPLPGRFGAGPRRGGRRRASRPGGTAAGAARRRPRRRARTLGRAHPARRGRPVAASSSASR